MKGAKFQGLYEHNNHPNNPILLSNKRVQIPRLYEHNNQPWNHILHVSIRLQKTNEGNFASGDGLIACQL
jgi:hypothetical protein